MVYFCYIYGSTRKTKKEDEVMLAALKNVTGAHLKPRCMQVTQIYTNAKWDSKLKLLVDTEHSSLVKAAKEQNGLSGDVETYLSVQC